MTKRSGKPIRPGASPGSPPGLGRRRRAPWIIFGLCALLVFDVLAWATWRVLALERAERLASAQADAAQRERLALWRMDSLVGEIIARESARPYFEYRASYAADRPYGEAWDLDGASAVASSSLTRGTGDSVVRLHYQIEPDGQVVSPQVPEPEARLDARVNASPEFLINDRLFRELNTWIEPERRAKGSGGYVQSLLDNWEATIAPESMDLSRATEPEPASGARPGRAPRAEREPAGPLASSAAAQDSAEADELADVQSPPTPADRAGTETATTASPEEEASDPEVDAAINSQADNDPDTESSTEIDSEPADADLRRRLFNFAQQRAYSYSQSMPGDGAAQPAVVVGALRPRWIGFEDDEHQLVFERDVALGDRVYRQGLWIDWPALRAQLLSIAVRLVPGATLDPVLGDEAESRGPDTLATIPLRLTVPAVVAPAQGSLTPTRVTLIVGWLAAGTALVAIGVVLRTSMRLAERRGRFVAAVTHELRSPLTSFRLHTDLLERATDPDQRAKHVGVLRTESARLGEVIESVLVYAGLRTPAGERGPVTLGDVLAPLLDTLHATASEAGAELREDIAPDAAAARVRVRRGGIERILANLVDNACRYAGADRPAVVTLSARRDGKLVRIRVADDGPGVDPKERELIFADFYRGSASSSSHRGIGLGLALGRGMARAEGGDLRLVETDHPGATFELTLPISPGGGRE